MTSKRTTFSNIAVAGVVVQVFQRDTQRTGYVVINRSATIIYVGDSNAIDITPSTNTVRLLQNEIMTILKSEGDDPTKELFAIATGASVLEKIESTET